MRIYTLLLVLFLHSCTADINNATVIPLDTWVQRTAPATGFDNVCFNTTAPDQEILVQFLGPSATGNRAILEFFPPVIIFFSTLSLSSRGTAMTDIVYQSLCPINVTEGTKEIRVSSEGSISVPYSLRVSVRNPSLNGGRIVTDQLNPGGYYYVDSSDTVNPLRIFSRHSSQFDLITFFGAFGRCPRSIDFDVSGGIQSSITIIEINSVSIPPLVQGRYYFFIPDLSGINIIITHSIGACQGTGCMVSLPPPSSTTTSATNTATTANSETSGGSSMRCFISGLYAISTAWIDTMFIRWPEHVMELWQSPCT